MTHWTGVARLSLLSCTRLDTDEKQKQTGFVSTERFCESTKPHLQVNAMALASPYAFSCLCSISPFFGARWSWKRETSLEKGYI